MPATRSGAVKPTFSFNLAVVAEDENTPPVLPSPAKRTFAFDQARGPTAFQSTNGSGAGAATRPALSLAALMNLKQGVVEKEAPKMAAPDPKDKVTANPKPKDAFKSKIPKPSKKDKVKALKKKPVA